MSIEGYNYCGDNYHSSSLPTKYPQPILRDNPDYTSPVRLSNQTDVVCHNSNQHPKHHSASRLGNFPLAACKCSWRDHKREHPNDMENTLVLPCAKMTWGSLTCSNSNASSLPKLSSVSKRNERQRSENMQLKQMPSARPMLLL